MSETTTITDELAKALAERDEAISVAKMATERADAMNATMINHYAVVNNERNALLDRAQKAERALTAYDKAEGGGPVDDVTFEMLSSPSPAGGEKMMAELARHAEIVNKATMTVEQYIADIDALAAEVTTLREALEKIANMPPRLMPDASTEPTPSNIRELVLERVKQASPDGLKVAAIKEHIAGQGIEMHEKTVGMTLYRLSKEGLVRRDGRTWYYSEQAASAPPLIPPRPQPATG